MVVSSLVQSQSPYSLFSILLFDLTSLKIFLSPRHFFSQSWPFTSQREESNKRKSKINTKCHNDFLNVRALFFHYLVFMSYDIPLYIYREDGI